MVHTCLDAPGSSAPRSSKELAAAGPCKQSQDQAGEGCVCVLGVGGWVVGTQPPNFSKPGEQKFVGPPRDSRKPFLSPSIKFSVCFQRLQKLVSLSQPRGRSPGGLFLGVR